MGYIAEIAERATGRRAVSLAKFVRGESSQVYRVELDGGGAVIVRLHDDPGVYRHTSRHHEALAALGLPVPKVLWEEPGALVLEALPGHDLRYVLPDLTAEQRRTIAAQVAGYQRRVVDAFPAGVGYGWVGLGEPGEFPTWKATIGWERQSDPRLLRAMATVEAEIDAVPPTCHLDDLTGKNVLIGEDGALVGLVDFDVVCYGDPRFWLGLTNAGLLCDLGDDALDYGDALAEAFAADRRMVAFYSAWIAVEFVGRIGASATQVWHRQMERGIARWLAAV